MPPHEQSPLHGGSWKQQAPGLEDPKHWDFYLREEIGLAFLSCL